MAPVPDPTHRGRRRSRRRFWNWYAESLAFAFGSFALAWYVGYLLYVRATAELFGSNTGILIMIAFLFVSWGLSGFWGARVIRAFRSFGLRGLWFLAPAPLIILGPVLVSLSLIH